MPGERLSNNMRTNRSANEDNPTNLLALFTTIPILLMIFYCTFMPKWRRWILGNSQHSSNTEQSSLQLSEVVAVGGTEMKPMAIRDQPQAIVLDNNNDNINNLSSFNNTNTTGEKTERNKLPNYNVGSIEFLPASRTANNNTNHNTAAAIDQNIVGNNGELLTAMNSNRDKVKIAATANQKDSNAPSGEGDFNDDLTDGADINGSVDDEYDFQSSDNQSSTTDGSPGSVTPEYIDSHSPFNTSGSLLTVLKSESDPNIISLADSGSNSDINHQQPQQLQQQQQHLQEQSSSSSSSSSSRHSSLKYRRRSSNRSKHSGSGIAAETIPEETPEGTNIIPQQLLHHQPPITTTPLPSHGNQSELSMIGTAQSMESDENDSQLAIDRLRSTEITLANAVFLPRPTNSHSRSMGADIDRSTTSSSFNGPTADLATMSSGELSTHHHVERERTSGANSEASSADNFSDWTIPSQDPSEEDLAIIPLPTDPSSTSGKRTTTNNTTLAYDGKVLAVPAFYEVENGKDYRLVKKIAKGGGGTILLARVLSQALSIRSKFPFIVVKELNDLSMRSETWREEFLQEVALMFAFQGHPNIVSLLGYCHNPPSILMKFYSLGTLQDWIDGWEMIAPMARMPLSFEGWTVGWVLSFTGDICAALQCLHDNGVIHCDLKPFNVLVDFDTNGKVFAVLTDFGIAKIIDPTIMLVKKFITVNVEGASTVYAAPEVLYRFRNHIQEEVRAKEAKSGDIYSLSMIIYGMLTSSIPWIHRRSLKRIPQYPSSSSSLNNNHNNGKIHSAPSLPLHSIQSNPFMPKPGMQSAPSSLPRQQSFTQQSSLPSSLPRKSSIGPQQQTHAAQPAQISLAKQGESSMSIGQQQKQFNLYGASPAQPIIRMDQTRQLQLLQQLQQQNKQFGMTNPMEPVSIRQQVSNTGSTHSLQHQMDVMAMQMSENQLLLSASLAAGGLQTQHSASKTPPTAIDQSRSASPQLLPFVNNQTPSQAVFQLLPINHPLNAVPIRPIQVNAPSSYCNANPSQSGTLPRTNNSLKNLAKPQLSMPPSSMAAVGRKAGSFLPQSMSAIDDGLQFQPRQPPIEGRGSVTELSPTTPLPANSETGRPDSSNEGSIAS